VRFDLAWTKQDADSLSAELVRGPEEGPAAGQRGVDERQQHDGDGQADGFGEDAECVGVADAQGQLIYRVVSGGATITASALGERGWPGRR
jgi:hypothetical protein